MSELPKVESSKPGDKLKYYQLLAFGALGLYVYKLSKSQNKSLLSGEPIEFGKIKMQLNPDKMVDSIKPWLNLEPAQKEMVATALKGFLKGIKEK